MITPLRNCRGVIFLFLFVYVSVWEQNADQIASPIFTRSLLNGCHLHWLTPYWNWWPKVKVTMTEKLRFTKKSHKFKYRVMHNYESSTYIGMFQTMDTYILTPNMFISFNNEAQKWNNKIVKNYHLKAFSYYNFIWILRSCN